MSGLYFAWLEITGKCQLKCVHCYAESGPHGSSGTMAVEDWENVIDQVAGLGAAMVQFIGGEPTLHPGLPALIRHALGRGLRVEVFTNLVHIPPHLWELFTRPGVQLATSFYSDQADEHQRITRGRGSHRRTRANIAEAVRRSIPLRVGVIDVEDGQRVDAARQDLASLGVRGEIRVDHLRQVGRGVRTLMPDSSQLCGQCGRGSAAIAPDGRVWPCVFSRWLTTGNVREESLAEILGGQRWREATAALERRFEAAGKPPEPPCDPRCGPNCGPACNPSCWPTGAGPCGPRGGCQPNYD